jgi:hypothetical protein
MPLNPETLKAMKDQVAHAKAVGQRKFLIDPESVSALIAERDELAREVNALSTMLTFLSQNAEHAIPLDDLRKRLEIAD